MLLIGLETFLSGMETISVYADSSYYLPALKPSLVEWKQSNTTFFLYDAMTLKPSLVEWKQEEEERR